MREPVEVPSPAYPGAPESVIARWQARRAPLTFAEDETLFALEGDLDAVRATRVLALPAPRRASAHRVKEAEINAEFEGQSALLALHGLVISHLRKSAQPPHTAALFHRIWQEHGDFLLQNLPTRWLISAVATFADHGRDAQERWLAQSLAVICAMMKLYEFERMHSGQASDQIFGRKRNRSAGLPLDMPPFALLQGGVDVNLLAPLWQMAQGPTPLCQLARHLLDLMNHDPRGLFQRLEKMRARRRRILAEKARQEDETS